MLCFCGRTPGIEARCIWLFDLYDVYYVKLNLCLLIRVSAPQRDRAKALYLAAIQNYSFQTR